MAPDRSHVPYFGDDAEVDIVIFDASEFASTDRRRARSRKRGRDHLKERRRSWPLPSPWHIAVGLGLAVIAGSTAGYLAQPTLDIRSQGAGAPEAMPNQKIEAASQRPSRPPTAVFPSTPSEPETTIVHRQRVASVQRPAQSATSRALPAAAARRPASANVSSGTRADVITPTRERNTVSASGAEAAENVASHDTDFHRRPSFACQYARSVSERMVCQNPELALADRVLDHPYERAIANGVPRRLLRKEQDDWLAIRESAARYGEDAVADVYAQRIDELEVMAQE